MVEIELFGPYLLNKEGIDYNVILFGEDVGVYVLGNTGRDGVFRIEHVGRAAKNLVRKLYEHEGIYKEFKFKFFVSEKAAFEFECKIFHQLKPRDTFKHPLRPAGSRSGCPVCGL